VRRAFEPAPVVAAALAVLAGNLAVHALPSLPGPEWGAACALLVLLALRRRAWRPAAWCVAACVWTAFNAEVRLADRLDGANGGRDFAVSGYVSSFAAARAGQATFGFVVDDPRPDGVPRRLRLTWYDAPGDALPGSHWSLTVRLRPPRGLRNPAGFDFERWLLVNDYGATGYVRSGAGAAPRPELVPAWLRFRSTLAERLRAAASSDDGAALLVALALGERHLFAEQHWDDFRRTGTSHLVAVSGMHVALLGLVAFGAVRRLWLRLPAPLCSFDLEAAALAAVLATAYYAALTGFAVPAQRSLVMVGVGLAVLVARRHVPAARAFAATLLAVLAWDPFASLSASFWLSFVAVAVLLALAAPRPLAPPRGHVFGTAWRFASWQLVIGLALVPLSVVAFGEVSLVGPAANLVAIPFFNLLLVPAAVLATVALSLPGLAALSLPAVGWVADLASATATALHWAAGLPAAALAVPAPPWPCFVVAALGVALAVAGPPVGARSLGWLAVVPLFAPARPLLPAGVARAVVLDVGHGLAVIVETRAHRLLFDAGPASPGLDAGADVAVPALGAQGRRGLDLLIVSHADNDHSGGAPAVVAAFPRADVLAGPDVRLPRAERCERGQRWAWDDVQFEILHPPAGFATGGNDGSCVLKVTTERGELLLTGDVERRAEGQLLAEALAADVVVVPHHGSATSSSAAFVAAVAAKLAIASAGFENRWRFPRPEVRARWQRSGARVVVTGEAGAVTVVLGTAEMQVSAERDGRHRYWQSPIFPW
jgi:competence protein ComEC